MTNFNESYAEFYNLLYKDKDYKKEAGFIHRLLQKHFSSDLSKLKGLDLACGTGKHIFEFEQLGLHLDGSDISSAMVAIAKKEAAAFKSNAGFYNFSFQECDRITKKYNFILSMFSAVDYLTDNADLNRSFANINGLLEAGGLFIFDCWNGNAVVRDYSPLKKLQKSEGTKEIVRTSNTSLDLFKQVATVKFNCILFENGLKRAEFDEVHPMRYFYFEEMKNFLETNNFEIVDIKGFLNAADKPEPYEWNITYVARKLG